MMEYIGGLKMFIKLTNAFTDEPILVKQDKIVLINAYTPLEIIKDDETLTTAQRHSISMRNQLAHKYKDTRSIISIEMDDIHTDHKNDTSITVNVSKINVRETVDHIWERLNDTRTL